jgi:hypothetical protein
MAQNVCSDYATIVLVLISIIDLVVVSKWCSILLIGSPSTHSLIHNFFALIWLDPIRFFGLDQPFLFPSGGYQGLYVINVISLVTIKHFLGLCVTFLLRTSSEVGGWF